MIMNETKAANIEWTARVLAGMLADMRGGWTGTAKCIGDNATREPEGHADLGELDADAVKALRQLTDELSHQWRVRLGLRERELWREEATAYPDAAELTRTRYLSDNGSMPDKCADQVIVQRTDTGEYFLVSTNDVETYVFRCDEWGERTDGSEIPAVSGQGVTRAQAILGIDKGYNPARLRTWNEIWVAGYGDDDDQEN